MAASNDLRDKDLVFHALNMWANHIETGDSGLSAVMAEKSQQGEIKALTTEQMEFVVRLRRLAEKALNHGSTQR